MVNYREKIRSLHEEFGIPEDYERLYGLTLQAEAKQLAAIENDLYGRPQALQPEAARAWRRMKEHAELEGVALNIVSAFRSVARQAEIIHRKIESGQTLPEILKVCAAPGYSEHHTGRAVDLCTDAGEPLSESFETTKAFRWLKKNAGCYGFKLSYPKENRHGIAYEPWHWAYDADR